MEFTAVSRSNLVLEAAVAARAEEASQQWTTTFNRRKTTPTDFARIYKALL